MGIWLGGVNLVKGLVLARFQCDVALYSPLQIIADNSILNIVGKVALVNHA